MTHTSTETALARAIRRVGVAVAPLAGFVLLSLYFMRPFPGPGQYQYGDIDGLFILSTLEWERHALVSAPAEFFHGGVFFGMGRALFFSDLLLGVLPIYAPLATLFGAPRAFALLHLLLPVLNASAMYFALRCLLGHRWPAMLGAIVFAFSPVQLYLGRHVQLSMAWWTPLALWALFAYARRPRPWLVGAAVFCVGAQFATAAYLGYFAAGISAAFLLAGFSQGATGLARWRAHAASLAYGLLAAIPFLPLVLGYREFGQDWQAARELREVVRYSAALPRYLEFAFKPLWWYESVMGPGASARPALAFLPALVPAGLALLGAGVGLANSRLRAATAAAIALTVTSFVLSLGPALQLHGRDTGVSLPYAFLFERFPVLAALRVAERFALPMMAGLSVLLSIGAAVVWRWRRLGASPKALLAGTLTALLLVSFVRAPNQLGPLPERNDLFEALGTMPPGAAIFIPKGGVWHEVRRMWAAAGTGVPLVNGYSGYEPPAYRQLARLVDEAPLIDVPAVLDSLLALGVRTVVLDREQLPAEALAAWRSGAGRYGPPVERETGEYLLLGVAHPGAFAAVSGWDRVETVLVARAQPAGSELAAPLFLRNRWDRPWLPTPGPHARPTRMHWLDASGAVTSGSGDYLRPPPVVVAHGGAQFDGLVRTRVPSRPGVYTLTLEMDGLPVAWSTVEVVAVPAASGEISLEAASTRPLQIPTRAYAKDRIDVAFAALNSGSVPWTGDFRLGYTWYRLVDGQREATALEGRLFLGREIAPGGGEIFAGAIPTPGSPGAYLLEFGVVHELIAWLSRDELPIEILPAAGS